MFRRMKPQDGIVKAAVFGANDGIVTTYAVVAGVAGAHLSAAVVLILGIANMISDAISMGLGDYIGEVSEREYEASKHLKPEHLTQLGFTSLVTFIAFVAAGIVPLFPYIFGSFFNIHLPHPLLLSSIAAAAALFLVGSLRTFFTKGVWWRNGLQMLFVGTLAASASYLLSFLLGIFVDNSI